MNDYQSPSYDNAPLNPYDYESTATRGGNGCRNVAIGCGLLALVGVVAIGIGSFYVASNARPFAAKAVVTGIESVVAETDLSEEQKNQIVVRVEELGEDFAAGNLTLEELGQIGQEIAESRTIIAGGVEFIVRKGIEDKAELDEEQSAQVKLLVQRLAGGIAEEKLEKDDFEPLMEIVLVKTGESSYEVRDDLSKEDVTKFLVELEKMVDEAEIPNEPYEVDIASEIDRIVDSVRDVD